MNIQTREGKVMSTKNGFLFFVATAAALFCSSGCGMDEQDYGSNWNQGYQDGGWVADAGTHWECFSANDCNPGEYCNEFNRCVPVREGPDGGIIEPPEVEEEFTPPASGERYVYVALTEGDMVARVDSVNLDVTTIEVGGRPTILRTAPGRDLAVVINSSSDSVSIIRTEDGADTVKTLNTPPHYNRLAIDPEGEYAVAHFELEQPDMQGIGSFQDVSVIRLEKGREAVFNVSVGFRPRQVVFSPDGDMVYVITEDGISVLDLQGMNAGFVAPTVPVSFDPLGEGMPSEVLIGPDGLYAFARWSNIPMVRAIDMLTWELIDTPLSAPPTDIDLSPEGQRLVAVSRSVSEVAVMEVPDDIGDASALLLIDCSPSIVGSSIILPGGEEALVYTNAYNDKSIHLLNLLTGEKRSALLRKGIRNLSISPDGSTALVLHNKIPGDPQPGDDFETQLDKRFGFSLLRVDNLFAKLQITEADPGSFAYMPNSEAAYLILADPWIALRSVLELNLINFIVSEYTVSSHPEEIGVVPGTQRLYVSQDHPMGRISFINTINGEMRTVTGFRLNSQITE